MKVLCFGSTSAIAFEFLKLLQPKTTEMLLVSRNSEKLARDEKDLIVRGFKVTSLVADLSEIHRLPELLSKIDQEFGTPDLLLIAHGDLGSQAESQKDSQKALSQIENNFLSPVVILTTLAEKMKAKSKGHIVVISSVAGDRGRASNYVYGSAKAGLTEFCSGLRQSLAQYGVHVMTVKPGFVDTPMTKEFTKGPLWATPQKVARDIARGVQKNKDVLYTPWFWWGIMWIIRHIPEFIFKKIKL